MTSSCTCKTPTGWPKIAASLGALLSICSLYLGSVAWCATRATVDGNPDRLLYWNSRTIHFWVNDQGDDDLGIAVSAGVTRRAFNLWSSPDCTDIRFVYRGLTNLNTTNAITENSDFTNVILWRKDGWPPAGAPEINYPESAVSKTTHFYNADTGEILDADIELNATDFTFEASGQGTQWDAETIIAHEVGILIGLAPSSDASTIMASALKNSPGTVRRTLSNDDISGVCDIYPFEAPTPLAPGQLPVVPQVDTGTCQLSGHPILNTTDLSLIAFIVLFCLRLLLRKGWEKNRATPRV